MKYTQFTAARADTGAVLPYAQATVYLAGTLTEADLFASDGMTEIDNPVEAGATGLVSFGVADGTYDIQVVSADGLYSLPLMEQVEIVDLTDIRGAVTSGRLSYASWAELAAITDASSPLAAEEGWIADIPSSDSGTHTDPVAGGTVANNGVFRYHATDPKGWKRIYDSLDSLVQAAVQSAAASASDAAGILSQAAIEAARAEAAREAVENYVNVFSAQPFPLPLTMFGQDSADGVTLRRLLLPAEGMTRAPAGDDWFVAVHFRTGLQHQNANYETLLNEGGAVTNGNSRILRMLDRGNTGSPGAWRFDLVLKDTGFDLFSGLAPALSTQDLVQFGDWFIVFGVVGMVPHLAFQRVGANTMPFRAVAPSQAAFGNFTFNTAQFTDATVERAGSLLTVRRASLPANYAAGARVMVQSVDQPSINGVYTIQSRLAGNAGFTVNSAGANFGITAANTSIREQRTPQLLADTIGALDTASGDRFGWGGGIQRIEHRYGSMPITEGLVDTDWIARYALRRIRDEDLPGTKRFAASASGNGGMVTDVDGAVTTVVTAEGTLPVSHPIGVDWLVLDDFDDGTVFPTELGTTSGTVRFSGRIKPGAEGLLATVRDSTGAVVVPQRVVASTVTPDGRFEAVIDGVPEGAGMAVHLSPVSVPAGSELVVRPVSVGIVAPIVSQSTWAYLFNTNQSGGALAPVSATSGEVSIIRVAGTLSDTGTNFTDQARFNRHTVVRGLNAASFGDGAKAAANKLVELRSTQLGRRVAGQIINMCRSGHSAWHFWADREWFTNSVGTVAAGGTLAGTWNPVPSYAATVLPYTEVGTATVWRGGTLALVDPTDPYGEWRLTGGQQVGTVLPNGTISGSVSGTFNHDTGAFSITDPVGGLLHIRGRMQFDTQAGSTSPRQANDGFTCWGEEDRDDSGHISNLLKKLNNTGATAFVYSWANYLLSYAGGAGRPQADVDFLVALDITRMRRRVDKNYPNLAGLPWIIVCDPRTASGTGHGEERIRRALRNYAKNTPNTTWAIGPVTGELDALASPHMGTGTGSGHLWGLTLGHAIARAAGYAGAQAEEIVLTGAVRSADGTYMDLTFGNLSGNWPSGQSLTAGDVSKIEGLFFATTDSLEAMAAVSVVGGANVTSITSDRTVRVTRGTGTFPTTTYWNCNIGQVLTDTTLAAENARLLNTLMLNGGGYSGIRSGQPVSGNPVNVLATQA